MADAFVKGHALGNDYLVVEPAALSFPLSPAAVRLLCDRHRGVGSDGVLALVPSDRAAAGVRISNPDGSEAEKSGNGLRIFARWLAEEGRVSGDRFTVETSAGVVGCRLRRSSGRIEEVSVDMGAATFRSEHIPCGGPPREVVAEDVEVGGDVVRITAVGIGNPHCVVFVADPARADLGRLGSALEHHPLFPRRTNVQLVRVEGRDRVRVRVWERGAGETLASGSSACAVAAACVRLGYTERSVVVSMDGGRLSVEVGADWELRMTGPAVLVYRGVLTSSFVAQLAR
ncbi:MAG: diaminopimelate epimerase [Chloroflexi bacterium]|nr:diaminopimelate epimerase [Chloroflexota bacterium]